MFVVAFLAGLLASFLSAMGSGGGALIIEPTLLLLGVDPATAIGSTKVGAIGTMVSSNSKFHKAGYLKWHLIWPFLIIAIIGSLIGPFLTTSLTASTIELLILVMGCLSLTLLIIRKNIGQREIKRLNFSTKRTWIGLALYFITTTLLAGFGSGIGIISSLVLSGLIGLSFLQTTAVRRAAGIITLPLQAVAFGLRGRVDWKLGVLLLLAMSIGSYVGTHLALSRGNDFVRQVTIVTSGLLLIALGYQRFL